MNTITRHINKRNHIESLLGTNRFDAFIIKRNPWLVQKLLRRNKYGVSRRSKRILQATPVVIVRTHPILVGVSVVAITLPVAVYLLKRAYDRKNGVATDDTNLVASSTEISAETPESSIFDVEQEVLRLENEGGIPSSAAPYKGDRPSFLSSSR